MALDMGSVASGFDNLMVVLGFFLGAVALVGAFWYFWYITSFKIPVTIHKVLDNGLTVEYKDSARRINKKMHENELYLRRLKTFVSNPPPDFYTKTFSGEKLYFRWDGGKVLVPQKVTYNSPLVFEAATYNILGQMATRIKNREERHKTKTFWDVYGSIIVWMAVVMISAITLWILFTKLEIVAGSINNLASSITTINAAQVVG